MSYLPTAICRWTYSGTTPVLNFHDTDGDAAEHTLTEANLMDLPQLNPRYDLLFRTVDLIYKTTDSRTVQSAAAGGDADIFEAPFTITYTFNLQAGEDVPEPGLAAKLAAWHQRLHIDANPTFTGGLTWTRTPGQLWTFGGIFSRHSAHKSVCQQIRRDLFLERETVVLGVPAVPSTYLLSKRASASNPPSSEETQTGTLTIDITPPDGSDDFNEENAAWVASGPQTYNGKGPGTIDVVAGDYTVQFLPIQTVASGIWFISESQPEVNVPAGGGDTATGSYDAVQRLFIKATGQENPTGFDLNAQDIIDMAPPIGGLLLKARMLSAPHMGQPGQRLVVCSESWEPS